MYVQQQAAWNNRVFLTAALRGDDNSTFGKDFKAAYYPKFSASWVISEEPWFKLPVVNDLRLRGALGAAGTQPGTFDAARLYQPTVGYLDAPGLVPASVGNPELKPERSQELELGFESTILRGKVDLSYTHYGRDITDAIVQVPVPPSAGFPGTQVINIGKVTGWGTSSRRTRGSIRAGVSDGSSAHSSHATVTASRTWAARRSSRSAAVVRLRTALGSASPTSSCTRSARRYSRLRRRGPERIDL
jgi:outer membrane cobalamin receptor